MTEPGPFHASPSNSPDDASAGGTRTPAQATPQPVSFERRERLREFQSALSEKLRRAQSAPLAINRLGLQIGPHRLLVDLVDAGEILAVPDIAPVPLAKPWYRGLANVRGNLIGIVDLSLYAGGPATPLDKESRVLTLSSDLRFAVGILVSRMLGLRSAADLTAPTPDALPRFASDVEAGIATPSTEPVLALFGPWTRASRVDAQGLVWQELDLAALTADARFVDIARA